MRLPSVIPTRGVDLGTAVRVLDHQASALENLSGTDAADRLDSYHAWASQASEQLGHVFDLGDVESLINTQRHDLLITRTSAEQELLVNNSISAEQKDRLRVFKRLLDEMRSVESLSQALPKFLVVPDTNVFLHQDEPVETLDWYALSGVGAILRVLVPMAALRQLDSAKRAQPGKKVSDANPETVRSRARVTSKFLREALPHADASKELTSKVSIGVLLDPVGHRRAEDEDTEIIERALALSVVSGQRVLLMTGDGNMQFNAQVAGLQVIALKD